MNWLHLIILAIVQGLTEFLPVSSSAHLILPSKLMNWPDQGPLIDLMAHLGSLGAVLLYYWREVVQMMGGSFDLLSFNPARRKTDRAKLALLIFIATPPALIAGLLMDMNGWGEAVRSPMIMAWAMLGFGIMLWLADIRGKRVKTINGMGFKAAFLIGLSQILAFIPGTSRSGITMTAARALGFTRVESARFSMLMAIPIILAGSGFAFLKLLSGAGGVATWQDGLVVASLSFVAAYIAIHVFMRLIEKVSFFPFMLYRVAFGIGLLWWLTQGS